jgi:hypothetical protein
MLTVQIFVLVPVPFIQCCSLSYKMVPVPITSIYKLNTGPASVFQILIFSGIYADSSLVSQGNVDSVPDPNPMRNTVNVITDNPSSTVKVLQQHKLNADLK